MSRTYDPNIDYTSYQVGDDDRPLLTTAEAANRLGIGTTQGVRALIHAGRLPSVRTGRIALVPAWAVEGRRKHRERGRSNDSPGGTIRDELTARIQVLEQALLALRGAEEHRRRAREHEEAAIKEWALAYEVLHDAVGAVLVPQSPRGL